VNYRAKLWPAKKAAADIEEACQQACLLFCTRTDAADLWGFTGSADAVLHQMAGKFASNSNSPSKTLVLTLGSEGSAQLRGKIFRNQVTFLCVKTLLMTRK
jgi:sugar/nucleoside kinase (ribokinase family)